MSDPRRLIDDPASPFERDLLASWEDEQPPAEARRRALALASGATVAASLAGGAAKAGSAAPKAIGAALAAKWFAVGAAVLAVATGTAAVVVARDRAAAQASPSPAPVAPVAPVAPRTTSAVAPTPAGSTVLHDDAAPSKAATVATVATGASAAHAPRRAPSAIESTLGEEVELLDRARAALAAGDPREALRLDEAYAARYPSGALAQEATVLRVEALLRAGDRARAERVGSRFLAEHPSSPHAARVRSLLADGP